MIFSVFSIHNFTGFIIANYSRNVQRPFTPEVIAALHPDVELGGYWSPPDCRARQKIVVIVPYRDRAQDMSFFLPNIHTFLKKQMLSYRIYFIEQVGIEKCTELYIQIEKLH